MQKTFLLFSLLTNHLDSVYKVAIGVSETKFAALLPKRLGAKYPAMLIEKNLRIAQNLFSKEKHLIQFSFHSAKKCFIMHLSNPCLQGHVVNSVLRLMDIKV